MDSHKLENVIFLQSNLFEKVPTTSNFDVIVSNPPYISQSDWEQLSPEVKKWEDKKALVSEENGMQMHRKIITHAKSYFRKREKDTTGIHTNILHHKRPKVGIPLLLLEIGEMQADEVTKLLMGAKYKDIKVWKDLAERERWVTATIE